jgi:hypothetical protein
MYSYIHEVPYILPSCQTKTTTEDTEDSNKGHPVILITVFGLLIFVCAFGLFFPFAH